MEVVRKLQQIIIPYIINTSNYTEVMEIIFECGNFIISLEKQVKETKCVEDVISKMKIDSGKIGSLEKEISHKDQVIKQLEEEMLHLKAENKKNHEYIVTILQRSKTKL